MNGEVTAVAAIFGANHVMAMALSGKETPSPQRGAVSESCLWTDREDGGEHCAFGGCRAAADEVDPAVEGVEAASLDATADRGRSEAELVQLPRQHEAVLAVRNRGEGEIAPPVREGGNNVAHVHGCVASLTKVRPGRSYVDNAGTIERCLTFVRHYGD